MIGVIQFLAPKSHCTYDFIHNRKRNRLTEDYQEANVERERWAVSDSDSSEEEQ